MSVEPPLVTFELMADLKQIYQRLGLEAHGISRCRVKEDFGPPLSHTEGNRTPHPGVRGQGTRFRKPCSISATNHGKTCPRLSLDFYAIIIMKEGTAKR